MHRRDQMIRQDISAKTVRDSVFLSRMAAVDSTNSRRLQALIELCGWPRTSVVGPEAAEGAFLVVQHTPFPAWQAGMLPIIETAVHAGELDAQDFALLFDRVHLRETGKQRYGTQLNEVEGTLRLEPVEQPAAVDSLRAGLGLPPLAEYLRAIEEATGMKVVEGDD